MSSSTSTRTSASNGELLELRRLMDTYVSYNAKPAMTTALLVEDTDTVRTAAAVYPLVTVKLHRTFCVDAPDRLGIWNATRS